VQRVWLVTDDAAPDPALLAQHPDLQLARVSPAALAGLPADADRIYLIDPLGNLVLAFPANRTSARSPRTSSASCGPRASARAIGSKPH
jgi:hypothetical protein